MTSLGNDLKVNERDIGKEAISPQSKDAWTLAQSGAHAQTSFSGRQGIFKLQISIYPDPVDS